ncbi:ATP synthase epsilon chain [mine drainage metagenome]|uniref:ATP synthase epsilon chain n=1 Tax=mine drainage metagenome TaxID=410659 RepID=A0A1J5PHF2_9ZZZZ
MSHLAVELVSAERRVWSGEASMVLARTTEGELGILPNHAPLLGVLVNGVVTIRVADGTVQTAAVHGGFLSVANNRVSILAEVAELGSEIDRDRAREALERAQRDAADEMAEARARTRLAAAGA